MHVVQFSIPSSRTTAHTSTATDYSSPNTELPVAGINNGDVTQGVTGSELEKLLATLTDEILKAPSLTNEQRTDALAHIPQFAFAFFVRSLRVRICKVEFIYNSAM